MCDCKGVGLGTYANQEVLTPPDHMARYRERVASGCDKQFISVDRCLVEEIQHLWSLGITTTGCCCGHNHYFSNEGEMFGNHVISLPYIGVIDEDVDRMKGLGYQVMANAHDINREDSFLPKTIENGRESCIGGWKVN